MPGSVSGLPGDGSFYNSGKGFLMADDTASKVLNITNGPITMEAWRDYELEGVHLTRLEVEALRERVRGGGTGGLAIENKREQAEWDQKAAKLGF